MGLVMNAVVCLLHTRAGTLPGESRLPNPSTTSSASSNSVRRGAPGVAAVCEQHKEFVLVELFRQANSEARKV